MYPDIVFPHLASQMPPENKPTQRLSLPSRLQDRNKCGWDKNKVDLKDWRDRLSLFLSCRSDIASPSATRQKRRVAKKNIVNACKQVRELVRHGMRARWLEVERGVVRCVLGVDVASAALMVRGLLEEADRCQLIEADLKRLRATSVIPSSEIIKIADRFYYWSLPRVRARSPEEIKSKVPRGSYSPMDPRLHECMNLINDYVHPNYGSHIVFVDPIESKAIETITHCLSCIYTIFFEISWLNQADSGSQDSSKIESGSVADTPIRQVLKELFSDFQDLVPHKLRNHAFKALADQIDVERAGPRYRNRDDPAARSIAARSDLKKWENTVTQSVANRHSTEEIALSAVNFFYCLNAEKIRSFRDSCLESILCGDVVGAATFARAVIEHKAVEIWVVSKSATAIADYARTADHDYVSQVEKKLAKCLAGTKGTSEMVNAQKDYWDTVYGFQKVNLLECIKFSGGFFTDSYDYLSSVLHGVTITGCDFLGDDSAIAGIRTQTFFYSVEALGQASTYHTEGNWAQLTSRLRVISKQASAGKSDQKIANLLKMPAKLKQGKDYFGDGSKQEPFCFRHGISYYETWPILLEQLEIRASSELRSFCEFREGHIVDKVIASDGEEIYFMVKPEISLEEFTLAR